MAPDLTAPDRGSRARRLALALAVGLAVVAIVVAGARTRTSTVSSIGATPERVAPSFTVVDLRDEAKSITLDDVAGRPLVLNFWAAWCVPCQKEMPAFENAYERLGDEVAFIGIDNQDDAVDARDLLDVTGVRYPTGFDPGGAVARSYGLFGMPTTVFVSPDGHVVAMRTGGMMEDQLLRAVSDLFGVETTA